MAIDPKDRQRVTDRNERIAEKRLERVLGYDFERLDKGRGERRKRVEGVLRETNRSPVALIEVKTLISGGVDPKDGAHFSTLDPRLPMPFDPDAPEPELRVRVMPAGSGNLAEHLAKAVDQYRQTVEDHPEFADLPLVVVLFADPFGPSLELIDRRIPEHPEISGLMYLVTNRLREAALSEESLEQLEARMDGLGEAGLPPPGYEWRYIANPHANRPADRIFVGRCLEGWPDDPVDPARLDPDTRRAMLDTMLWLSPEKQKFIRLLHDVGGFAEIDRRVEASHGSLIEELTRQGLLERRGTGGIQLSLLGRTAAAVDAAQNSGGTGEEGT